MDSSKLSRLAGTHPCELERLLGPWLPGACSAAPRLQVAWRPRSSPTPEEDHAPPLLASVDERGRTPLAPPLAAEADGAPPPLPRAAEEITVGATILRSAWQVASKTPFKNSAAFKVASCEAPEWRAPQENLGPSQGRPKIAWLRHRGKLEEDTTARRPRANLAGGSRDPGAPCRPSEGQRHHTEEASYAATRRDARRNGRGRSLAHPGAPPSSSAGVGPQSGHPRSRRISREEAAAPTLHPPVQVEARHVL